MKPTHIIASGKTRAFDGPIEPLRPIQLVSFAMNGDGVFIDADGGTVKCPLSPEYVLPYPFDEDAQPMDYFRPRPKAESFCERVSRVFAEIWDFDFERFDFRPLK